MTYFHMNKYLANQHNDWHDKDDFPFFPWLVIPLFFAFGYVVEH